jgi:hypothetical protein
MPVNPSIGSERGKADRLMWLSLKLTERAFGKYFKYFLDEDLNSSIQRPPSQ